MHDPTKSTPQDFPDLGALKAGDEAAWQAAFWHLWPIALRAAQNPQARLEDAEAEDVASEAIEILISKIEQVTSFDHAEALVSVIASRRAISHARSNSAAKRPPPNNRDFALAEIPAVSSTNMTDIDLCDMIVLLRRAFDVLDVSTRLMLLEKTGDGLTYNQISKKHGVPLGTVCTNVARGLKKVRAHLQESPLLMKELREYLR